MKQYYECNAEMLADRNIYIFGSGNWGRRCHTCLKNMGISVKGFIDNNESMWGKTCRETEIYPPQAAEGFAADDIIIVAIQNRSSVLHQLDEMGIGQRYIFIWNKIYYRKDVEVLGFADRELLREYLDNSWLYLYGEGKYAEDFKYVFDNLKLNEITDDDIPEQGEDRKKIIILCDFNPEHKEELLAKKGYVKNTGYVYGEELFSLLDDVDDESVTIPSAMMYKTLYAPMTDQIKCTLPFKNIQVSSRFSVHCCCSDWGAEIGNLEKNTLNEIWNSNTMKIFRLSIINRTYSFCNSYNCVHMVMNPGPATERMIPPKAGDCPERLEIGIDRTCNLYCESCRKEVCVEQGTKRELIERIKDRIIESGWPDKVKTLLLGGQGEVFFSQVYKDIMYHNASDRNTLDLRTNGILLTEKEFERLEKIYNSLSIIVSIDAATEATYKKLRRSHDEHAWEKLQRNLKMLSEMRRAGRIGFFQINMCVQMDNYREMPDFVKMGLGLGVDRVYLTPIRNWGTYTAERFKDVEIYDGRKVLKKEVAEVMNNPVLKHAAVQCAFEQGKDISCAE